MLIETVGLGWEQFEWIVTCWFSDPSPIPSWFYHSHPPYFPYIQTHLLPSNSYRLLTPSARLPTSATCLPTTSVRLPSISPPLPSTWRLPPPICYIKSAGTTCPLVSPYLQLYTKPISGHSTTTTTCCTTTAFTSRCSSAPANIKSEKQH